MLFVSDRPIISGLQSTIIILRGKCGVYFVHIVITFLERLKILAIFFVRRLNIWKDTAIKMQTTILSALLFGAVIMSSCATLINGKSQNVAIAGYPAGAEAVIDGNLRVITPGVVRLSRNQEHNIVIQREGYAPYREHLGQHLSGWIFGNILFTPIPGAVAALIDYSDGAMWNLETDQVTVALTRTRPWPHWPTTQACKP